MSQKKLKASGRFDQIPASAPRAFSASTLPQVLAHELRLSTPIEEVLERSRSTFAGTVLVLAGMQAIKKVRADNRSRLVS